MRIHRPEKQENSWTCAYEIDWPEGQRAFESTGIDALQALVLALQMIGAEIYSSAYYREGRLLAYDSGKGYGFPVAASLRDLLVGVNKVAMQAERCVNGRLVPNAWRAPEGSPDH